MTPSDFNLWHSLSRILNVIPSQVCVEEDGTIRFLLALGTDNVPHEIRDYVDEACLLVDVEINETGSDLAFLLHENVGGIKRYCQVIARDSYLPGPIFIEATVFPETMTRQVAAQRVEALAYVAEEADGPATEQTATPDEQGTPRTASGSRPRMVRAQDRGLTAWLRRLFA